MIVKPKKAIEVSNKVPFAINFLKLLESRFTKVFGTFFFLRLIENGTLLEGIFYV